MLLEAALVEIRVVEATKFRRQPTEHPDEPELPGDAIASETEPHLSREFEAVLGLSLDFTERISGSETVRDQVDAAVGCIRKVTGILGRVEGPPQEGATRRQGLRPVSDVHGEDQVDAGAEAVEPMLLDQLQAEGRHPTDYEAEKMLVGEQGR